MNAKVSGLASLNKGLVNFIFPNLKWPHIIYVIYIHANNYGGGLLSEEHCHKACKWTIVLTSNYQKYYQRKTNIVDKILSRCQQGLSVCHGHTTTPEQRHSAQESVTKKAYRV